MEVDGGGGMGVGGVGVRIGEAAGSNLEGEDDAGSICRQVRPGLVCLQQGRL